MRMIGTINDATRAERFSDWLESLGMANRVEQPREGEPWQVWVEDDDHLDSARDQLRQFETVSEADVEAAREKVQEQRKESEQKAEKARARVVDYRTQVLTAAGHRTNATYVLLLLIFVIAAAAGTLAGETRTTFNPLTFTHIEPGDRPGTVQLDRLTTMLRSLEVWRLWTPVLLHGGILHLLFNAYWLWKLGGRIESAKGTLFFVCLVLATGIAGNLAQYLLTGPNFLGFSGVNYALFGYLWVKMRLQPWERLGVLPGEVLIMMAWLVLSILVGFGDIAHGAHVGGLLAGAAVGATPWAIGRAKRRLRQR